MNARERVLSEAVAELREPGGPASSGAVRSWDLSTRVDGPGTRFVIFTSGCPLRCLYCENPDSQRMRDGRRATVDGLMAEIAKYRDFLAVAGGGVTISGGEPLLQPAFTGELLRRCRALGLHTALDTSEFLGARASDALLASTGLILLGIKAWNPSAYRRLTGAELRPTLRFAERLARLRVPVWVPVWVRFVLGAGVTAGPDEVAGIASFSAALPNIEYVDVLPSHRLGAAKYDRPGIPFPSGTPNRPAPTSSPGFRRPSRPTAWPPADRGSRSGARGLGGPRASCPRQAFSSRRNPRAPSRTHRR
ncbi:radical SAM protein [Actinomadura sp. 21ATH]|uniref:radical SAM protein n=1 Tax=Actinomadura sp. 21ATH TaxID=1735444 RepID=UPI0035BFA903